MVGILKKKTRSSCCGCSLAVVRYSLLHFLQAFINQRTPFLNDNRPSKTVGHQRLIPLTPPLWASESSPVVVP